MPHRAPLTSCLVLVLVLLFSASGRAATPIPAGEAGAEARELYASTCTSCHGADGAGDGLVARGLPARPASFADPAWQNSVTDEQIERAIVGGGVAVGKSPLMPPTPGLESKPAVVAALRAMIRGFAQR